LLRFLTARRLRGRSPHRTALPRTGITMRLFFISLIALGAGCSALAGNEPPAACPPGADCPPPEARDGICEHPALFFDGTAVRYAGDRFSHIYERRCILRAKSFAVRSGDELRLTFRNGGSRIYKNSSKECDRHPQKGRSREECKDYMLYDYFPDELFLVQSATMRVKNGCWSDGLTVRKKRSSRHPAIRQTRRGWLRSIGPRAQMTGITE
jgi:hypothetical protein